MHLRIKELAAERGKTMTDISHETRISYARLLDLANDKGSPSLKTLKRIADALSCKVVDLIDETSPNGSHN